MHPQLSALQRAGETHCRIFGDSVPQVKVASIFDMVRSSRGVILLISASFLIVSMFWQIEESDGLLVVGSSLEVFSAYRFVCCLLL